MPRELRPASLSSFHTCTTVAAERVGPGSGRESDTSPVEGGPSGSGHSDSRPVSWTLTTGDSTQTSTRDRKVNEGGDGPHGESLFGAVGSVVVEERSWEDTKVLLVDECRYCRVRCNSVPGTQAWTRGRHFGGSVHAACGAVGPLEPRRLLPSVPSRESHLFQSQGPRLTYHGQWEMGGGEGTDPGRGQNQSFPVPDTDTPFSLSLDRFSGSLPQPPPPHLRARIRVSVLRLLSRGVGTRTEDPGSKEWTSNFLSPANGPRTVPDRGVLFPHVGPSCPPTRRPSVDTYTHGYRQTDPHTDLRNSFGLYTTDSLCPRTCCVPLTKQNLH